LNFPFNWKAAIVVDWHAMSAAEVWKHLNATLNFDGKRQVSNFRDIFPIFNGRLRFQL